MKGNKDVWKKAIIMMVLISLIGAIGVGAMLPQGEQSIKTPATPSHESEAVLPPPIVYLTGFTEDETSYRVASGTTYLQTGGHLNGNGSHWTMYSVAVKLKKIGDNVGPVIVTLQGVQCIFDGDELSTEGTWVQADYHFGIGVGGCGEHPYPWTITVKAPQATGGSGVGWAYNDNYQSYLFQLWGRHTPLLC